MSSDPARRLLETIANAYNPYELIASLAVDLLPEIERRPNRDAQPLLGTLGGLIETIVTDFELGDLDIEALRSIGERLDQTDTITVALKLWLRRLEQLTTEPQPESASEFELVRFRCKCGKRPWGMAWKVVNATRRPDLQRHVQEGTIFPTCPACGKVFYMPLFYCNPDRGEYLIYAPGVDDERFEALRNAAVGYLENVPADLRRDISNCGYYEGMPGPWVGPIDDFAAIFRVDSSKLLREIVTEDLIYDAQPMNVTIETYQLGVQARGAVADGAMRDAARYFARLFLLDQSQFSVLGEVSSCLREVGDMEGSELLADGAVRLRQKLRAEKVVYDGRAGGRYPSPSPQALIAEIWGHGLPAAWGFGPIIDRVRQLAGR